MSHISKIARTIKNNGLSHTLLLAERKLTQMAFPPKSEEEVLTQMLKPLISAVDFNGKSQYGDLLSDQTPRTISWLVPPFFAASGGHETTFRFVSFLQDRGFENNVYVLLPDHKTHFDPYEHLTGNFAQILSEDVHFKTIVLSDLLAHPDEVIEDSRYLFATRFETAYAASLITNVYERFYFVQDRESMFFPTSYLSVCAENSYKLGLHGVCASPWLQSIARDFGMESEFFHLGYSPEVYGPAESPREPKSIAFYARERSGRRAVELGLAALEIAQRMDPDLQVYLYGTNSDFSEYDLNYTNLGIVSQSELSDLYKRVSVGLSFSLTNYSLVPTEMMATGLPVVELDTECTRSVFTHNENILLSKSEPNAIADAIITLVTDPELHKRISQGALDFTEDKSWEQIWPKITDKLNIR